MSIVLYTTSNYKEPKCYVQILIAKKLNFCKGHHEPETKTYNPRKSPPENLNDPTLLIGITLTSTYISAGSSTVVVTQPGFINARIFREVPVPMQCPYCQATITTSTSYEVGTLTWIACFVVFIVG